ncbi:MAG: ATP-binding protein [Gemmatimonadota bacterium]|nr:ATP-binding protein [Gemmatimonadota bacterium]
MIAMVAVASAVTGSWVYTRVSIGQDAREDVRVTLSAVLNAVQGALHASFRSHRSQAIGWATFPAVVEATRELLDTSRSPEELSTHPAQTSLRDLLLPTLEATGYQGYFLVDVDGVNLASSRDANIGVTTLLRSRPGFLEKVWSGQTAVSMPQPSDVPLPGPDGVLRSGYPTLFVGAPVRSESGEIVAAFAFRLDFDRDFDDLLRRGDVGRSGETYAVDGEGRLLGASRFETALRATPFFDDDPHTPLEIYVRNPGVEFMRTQDTTAVNLGEAQPTLAAAALMKKEDGEDMTGYPNYRGIPVVGSWKWDSDLGMGLTVEQDVAEAYRSLRSHRMWVDVLNGMVLLLVFATGRVYLANARRTHEISQEMEWGMSEGARDLEHTRSRMATTTRELERFFDLSIDMVCIASTDGFFTRVNPAFIRVLGHAEADLMARPFLDFVHPDDATATLQEVEKLAGGEPTISFSNRYRCADGAWKWLEWTAASTPEGLIYAIARDETERRETEAVLANQARELRQAQKMEAVGRLAGGVAHDFNNLLTAIIGFGEQVLFLSSPGEKVHRHTTQILRAAGRAADLTRQLLAFSRLQVVRPKVVDVNEVVHDVTKMLGRIIGDDVGLEVSSNEHLWPTYIDVGALEQIVVNLAVNARDAMVGGGVITISTDNVRLDGSRDADTGRELPDGDYVLLSVRDTGTGMSEEVQRQIFDPFFTTKEEGKGTGLGLSTCFGLVKQASGSIDVRSEEGVGSTFSVYLPRTSRAGTRDEDKVPENAVAGGSETILVVDDDVQVRAVVCAILETHGYRVLEAAGGSEAIRISSEVADDIHLLLTDVVMNGINGGKLAETLAPSRPEMRLMFMSGHAEDAMVHTGVMTGRALLVKKPFQSLELARTVRACLDGSRYTAQAFSRGS